MKRFISNFTDQKQISMQNIEELKAFLGSPKQVVITTHHKPDADALGSSLALAAYLKKKGHQVQVISPSDYPRFLHWLPGNAEVLIFEEDKAEVVAQHFAEADLICCLDFSSYSRVEKMSDILQKSPADILLIDHHINPSIQAKYNYWDEHAAATAQLVFRLIGDLGDQALIDVALGEAIYAGILTDTASFKHPTTSKEVHQIAGELIDVGVNTSKVHHLIYDNNTALRLKFLGHVLANKMYLLPEFKTCYIVISAEELKQYQSQTGDTEGIVNYALSIEGVVFAAIIIEKGDKVKMSFRSVGSFSANDFAQKHFQGGGHKNAAGGISELSLEETARKFLELLPLYRKELNQVIR